VLPAAAILALTLAAAIWSNLQGILLTVGGLGFFVVAMSLLPKLKIAFAIPAAAAPVPPAAESVPIPETP
jgi:NADH:ubiquinone oxidoreductase subunit 4 (subunit M)